MRFLLIDKITSWEPGRSATAIKNVALSEDFFEEHFPGRPIMPGTLILEGMAQLAGLLLEESVRRPDSRPVKAVLSIVERAKFRSPVGPGDQLEYSVSLVSVNELGGQVDARAACRGEVKADCRLVFAFHEFANERLERLQQEVVSLWMRDLRS